MFFKKSKTLLVGLLILIFSSSLVFTSLNSVNNNLQTSYNVLSNNGNLNDFVINEKYTMGIVDYSYTLNTNDITIVPTKDSITGKINWTDSYLNFYSIYNSDPTYSKYLVQYVYTPPTGTAITDSLATSQIDALKIELESIVSSFVKNILNTELNKLPISYRPYNAIDISNNKQNIFYKVVESSPSYSIDKLVVYGGNNLVPQQDLVSIINGFYSDTVSFDNTNKYSRELLNLLSKCSWSDDAIKTDITQTIDYFNANPSLNPYDYKSSVTYSQDFLQRVIGYNGGFLKPKQTGFIHQILDDKSFSNKGFKIDFNVSYETLFSPIPAVGSFTDFTSYQAVVTPAYINTFNKQFFSQKEFNLHLNDSQKDFENWFASIDSSFKVVIDSTEYLIMGSGITPDYMYPVVSFDRPVPNYNTEAIIYSNPNGYARIADAFRGNSTESFIVGKFNNVANQAIVLDQINQIATNLMSWPSGTKAAYLASDLNNTITPAALRLQFVPETLKLTTIISTFLTLIILFLSIIVSIFVIKRFIENNKNNLGILLANGFKKWQIVLCIVLFLAIPILIGTAIGFGVGFVLQIPIMSLFLSFWTIPTSVVGFSVSTFFIVIFVQLILFSILGWIFSFFSLRGESSQLMKDEAKYKMSRFAMTAKKPFQKFGIMSIFRSSIAFQSLWKLFLLSLMSGLSILSIVFSLSTNDKFRQAALDTYKSRNYSYSYKLITPTNEAGQYYAVPYQYSGMTLESGSYFSDTKPTQVPSNPISQNYLTSSYYSTANSYPQNTEFSNLVNLFGNYQLLSSTDDNSGQNTGLMYLKNKVQNQITVDHFLGAFGVGANPWQIAIKLMPNNQINYANNSFRNILAKVFLDTQNTMDLTISGTTTTYTYRDALLLFVKQSAVQTLDSSSKFVDNSTGSPIVYEFDNSKISTSYSGISNIVLVPQFIEFFLKLFQNQDYFNLMYNINFNKVIVDEGDKPYSYVDFNFESKNNSIFKTSSNETLVGINSDDNYVSLTNSNNENINYKLFEKTNGYIPVIVNAYAQKKYGLNINDVFKIQPLNKTDRYVNDLSLKTIADQEFKVVDILTTYQGSEFFISHENANNILGLVNYVDSNNVFDYKKSGFNGVFSKSTNLSLVTKGISLYSPSGLYPASDTFSPTNSILLNVFNSPAPAEITASDPTIVTNLDWAKKITGITSSTASSFVTDLAAKYGTSASYYVLSSLTDKNSTEEVFLNLGSTINNVQISVIAVIVAISLVIVILISAMIVLDSIKLASYLKCLGLSDWKNALSFLMIYFPVFILGLALAVPVVYLLTFLYTEMIFSSAGILLLINPTFLNFFIPMICVLAVFFVSFLIAWYKIKKTNLPKIIK